jgi:CubicO group peptidase (beta-lactamase class C family)
MRRPPRFSILLALSLTPVAVAAQTVTQSSSSAIVNGFDASRLARIDQALQSYVDKNEIAGAVALVLRNGQPAYQRAFGPTRKRASR